MKKTLLLLIGLSCYIGYGQNLVRNGSFENTAGCPILATDLENITSPWTSYFGTPDYFHQSCGFPGDEATTNNALPFDGEGFVGIDVYGDTGSAYRREYLHGELEEALEEDKYYRVTFYVKPLNNDAQAISYAINNLGAILTDSVMDSIPQERVYRVKPQVRTGDPVATETYWTAICGIFKAQGGERFITIGNFNEDINTQVSPLLNAANPQRGYYLIDYVEVVPNDYPQLPEDTIICEEQRIDLRLNQPGVSVTWNSEFDTKNFTITEPGIYWATIAGANCSYTDTLVVKPANCNNCKLFVPNAFTPNDDGKNELFIVQPEEGCEDLISYRINIFDRWGQKIFESDSPDVHWDGSGAEGQGVYTYTIEYEYPLARKTQTQTLRGAVTVIY